MALHEGNDVLYSRRGAGAQAMKGAGCASSHLAPLGGDGCSTHTGVLASYHPTPR